MLVLPIINRDRILNVEVRLKTVTKIRNNIKYDDISPSDIIVNSKFFSDSIYNAKNMEASDVTEFIRNNSIVAKNDFFVSTKEVKASDTYDIYQISLPPKKISNGLDRFYGSLILDLKNEEPSNIKGKYVNLAKLGISEHITKEKLDMLTFIASNINNNYNKAIVDNNLEDLIDTLKFLDLIECYVIEKSSISVLDFEKVLKFMNTTNGRDAKSLNNYYNIAKDNKEVYSLLSKLYNIVYKDSLKLIRSSKDKIKIKTTDEKKGAI